MKLSRPPKSKLPKEVFIDWRKLYQLMKLQEAGNKRSLYALALLVIVADRHGIRCSKTELELWREELKIRSSLRTHTLNIAINELTEKLNGIGA